MRKKERKGREEPHELLAPKEKVVTDGRARRELCSRNCKQAFATRSRDLQLYLCLDSVKFESKSPIVAAAQLSYLRQRSYVLLTCFTSSNSSFNLFRCSSYHLEKLSTRRGASVS